MRSDLKQEIESFKKLIGPLQIEITNIMSKFDS